MSGPWYYIMLFSLILYNHVRHLQIQDGHQIIIIFQIIRHSVESHDRLLQHSCFMDALLADILLDLSYVSLKSCQQNTTVRMQHHEAGMYMP